MLIRNCQNDYHCLVTTKNGLEALKFLKSLCRDLVTSGPEGLSRTILSSNLVQCLVALLARQAHIALRTDCTKGPDIGNAGDGHHPCFDSSSISNSSDSGCGGDATDDDGSRSESFGGGGGGDNFNTDFPGVAPQTQTQTRLHDDPSGDQNHGAVWWRLVMLACRTVALMPEGRQALVSSNALLPLLIMCVSHLAAVEGPAEDSAWRDARGLIELNALSVLHGRISGGCGTTVPRLTEQDMEGSGDNHPVLKRQKVGICKSDVPSQANPPEPPPPSMMAWTMAPQTATATTASDVRGSTHARGPSCSGCTANTTKGAAVIGVDGSIAAAAAAAPTPQLGAAVPQYDQSHARTSGPREQHHHNALLLRLRSPLLAENLQLLLDLMLDEAAAVRPFRGVRSVPDPAAGGDPLNLQDVGCCSSGSDGGGNEVLSTGMVKGIHEGHPLLLRRHLGKDSEGEQEAKWIGRRQAMAVLPVVQKSWRAAREAAVAADLATRRGRSPSSSAVVPPPCPPQPPPPEVLRGLACLVMLLADAAVEVQTVATRQTERKAAAGEEERGGVTGKGVFCAAAGAVALDMASGVRLPTAKVRMKGGGDGSGSGSGRPGGSGSGSGSSSTRPGRNLLQPTEWLRLLEKHWEIRPLRLTQKRRRCQRRRPPGAGAGGFRQPTSRPPANILPSDHCGGHIGPVEAESTSSGFGCHVNCDDEDEDEAEAEGDGGNWTPLETIRSMMQELLPASCHCPLMDTPDRQLLPYIRRVRSHLQPHMVARADVDLVRSGSERFVTAAAGGPAGGAAAGTPLVNATGTAGNLAASGDAAGVPAAMQPSSAPPVAATPNVVTATDCEAAMRRGFTVVVRAAGARSSKICAVQDQLESILGLPAGANMYCTPPGNQGLAAHYDDHCVLVLQLQGAKEWLLQPPRLLPTQLLPLSYCPRLPLDPIQTTATPSEPAIFAPVAPLEVTRATLPGSAIAAEATGMAMEATGRPAAPPFVVDREGATAEMTEPAAVTARVVLQPGNLLYVPRGWGHQAVAVAVAGTASGPVRSGWNGDDNNHNDSGGGGSGGGGANGSGPGKLDAGSATEGALPSGVSLHVTFGFEVEAIFTWQAVAHCIVALVAAERRQQRQRATWEADGQVQEIRKEHHHQLRRDSLGGDQAEVEAKSPVQRGPPDATLAAQVLLHAWLVQTAFSARTRPLLLLRKAAPLTALACLTTCSQLQQGQHHQTQQPPKHVVTAATAIAVDDAGSCILPPFRRSPPAGGPALEATRGPLSAALAAVLADAPRAVASAPMEAGEGVHAAADLTVMGIGSAAGGGQQEGGKEDEEEQALKTVAARALLHNLQSCLQWGGVGEEGPESPPSLQQRKTPQAATLTEQPSVKPLVTAPTHLEQVRFSRAGVGTGDTRVTNKEDLQGETGGDLLVRSDDAGARALEPDIDMDFHLPYDRVANPELGLGTGLGGGAPSEAEPLTVLALAQRLMQLLHQQWDQQHQDEDVEQLEAKAQSQTAELGGKLRLKIGGVLRRAIEEVEWPRVEGVAAGRCSPAQGQGEGEGTGHNSSVAAFRAAATSATVDSAGGMPPHVSCGPYDAPYWLEWTTELLSKTGRCMHTCNGVTPGWHGDCVLADVETVANGPAEGEVGGLGEGCDIGYNRLSPGHGMEPHREDTAGGHADEYRDASGSLDAVEVCNDVMRAIVCGAASTAVDSLSGNVEDTNPWIQAVLHEAEGLLATASSCGDKVAQWAVALVTAEQRDCLRARLRARHALLALHVSG